MPTASTVRSGAMLRLGVTKQLTVFGSGKRLWENTGDEVMRGDANSDNPYLAF